MTNRDVAQMPLTEFLELAGDRPLDEVAAELLGPRLANLSEKGA